MSVFSNKESNKKTHRPIVYIRSEADQHLNVQWRKKRGAGMRTAPSGTL